MKVNYWMQYYYVIINPNICNIATASSLVSAVNCYRGYNQSRMQLHVWSLEPGDPIAWRLFYANCIGYQYASELLSRRPCWYTNVGMACLHHTCRHTASSHGGRCHLRSAESGQLTVPRTRTIYGDRSFAVHGPVVWNSLPASSLLNISLPVFRKRLKMFLF